MNIEDLYAKAQAAAQDGRLVQFKVKLQPPNPRAVVSLTGPPTVYFDEDIGDDEQAKWPVGRLPHDFVNYYFLRKQGQKGWQFIGESRDWLNMWEVDCPTSKFSGQGTYSLRAIMIAEADGKLFFGQNAVKFDVEGGSIQQQASIHDGVYPCSATLHIKDGKAVVVLHSMFGLPAGTTIPLYRSEHNLKVESVGVDSTGVKNGHTII